MVHAHPSAQWTVGKSKWSMVGVDTGAGGGAGVGKDIKRHLQIKPTRAQYSITLHPQKKNGGEDIHALPTKTIKRRTMPLKKQMIKNKTYSNIKRLISIMFSETKS